MKFVINTNYIDKSAGGRVLKTLCGRLVKLGHQVTFNDWSDYSKHDVVIFMAPDSRVREVKKKFPDIICTIFDPKLTKLSQRNESELADLLIVSSIEQRESFINLNKNVCVYYMFPETEEKIKLHIKKDKIVIGYHGNKQHLDAMSDVSWALDKISDEYDIEFLAIYNIEKLGKWRKNLPKKCPVRHVQWGEKSYVDVLSSTDIGIVPSLLPQGQTFSRPIRSFLNNPEGYSQNDYVMRFKMSNNPGRIYIFSQLGIPVVSDFTPSACQIIKDGYSGMLVGNKHGWYSAIEDLIRDHEKRTVLSENLKKNIADSFSIDLCVNIFLNELQRYFK